MDSALKVQGRVIYALMMREVHTIYGTSRLGYLWALIQTMWNIFVFWGLRYALGASDPHGMSILVFLLMGFGIYHIFSGVIGKCMGAVAGNKALLTFPQVTPLDIMVARMIIVWATEIVSSIILIFISECFGKEVYINDFGGLLVILLITPLLGLGVGMICSSLAVVFPTVEKIVPMILRLMLFSSAVFYSATVIPSHIMKYLWYNPMIQLVEWGRYCLSKGYPSVDYSVLYIGIVTMASLCFGLLLERYVRRKIA